MDTTCVLENREIIKDLIFKPAINQALEGIYTIYYKDVKVGVLEISTDNNLFTRNQDAVIIESIYINHEYRRKKIGISTVSKLFDYCNLISGDATYGDENSEGFDFWQHIGANFLDEDLDNFEMTLDYYENNCEDGQTFPFLLYKNDFKNYLLNKNSRQKGKCL